MQLHFIHIAMSLPGRNCRGWNRRFWSRVWGRWWPVRRSTRSAYAAPCAGSRCCRRWRVSGTSPALPAVAFIPIPQQFIIKPFRFHWLISIFVFGMGEREREEVNSQSLTVRGGVRKGKMNRTGLSRRALLDMGARAIILWILAFSLGCWIMAMKNSAVPSEWPMYVSLGRLVTART